MFGRNQMPLETIETARLSIVPMTQDEFFTSCRDETKTVDFREAMEELADRFSHDRKSRFAWYTNRLIYRKEDGACIGSISFMNSPAKDPDKVGLVEIGYTTEEAYRGQGYMTEAVAALCDYALLRDDVYGIIAGVMDDNPASSRVLEKCGFQLTDHSETLHLQVRKKIPAGKKPLNFFQRR